jgi:DTW domain-containing protein YfiP
MSKRSKCADRCPRCRMHLRRCICEHIPCLELETHLALVMHHRELTKPTATGPLALEALAQSRLYVHGLTHAPLDLGPLHHEGRRVLLLFPAGEARVLDRQLKDEDSRPVTLVVPDGTWGQAGRMPSRVKGLDLAESVTLPAGGASRWGIRRETREGGLATFEAIARAFGILESFEVQIALEALFNRMVKNTLEVRHGLDADGAH